MDPHRYLILYINNKEVMEEGIKSKIGLSPETTISTLKKILHKWLLDKGISDYNVRLVFNNGQELSPQVFNTNNFDNNNFQVQFDIVNGGGIYIKT